MHAPCLSDSDDEDASGRTVRASTSPLAGPRNDTERELQGSIPYPLNAIDDEARRVEKYMYCAAYYLEAPYRKSHYRGPSFLEYRRAKGPRRALDVGSGFGYWLRDASASWPETKFVGFDIFDLPPVSMSEEQLGRITFKQGNILDAALPFNAGEFDYIRLANMRLAIPDNMWASVLQKLCRLLSEKGFLEILDDGWTYVGSYYNANMSTFRWSYEQHFEFTVHERGFREAITAPKYFERVVERPLRNVENMVPQARSTIQVANTDAKLDLRWRKTLFLAEQAIRSTLLPIVARTEPDPRSPAAQMTPQAKHDLFAQDVDDLVNLLKVTPNVHRYRPTQFHSLVYQRRTRSQ